MQTIEPTAPAQPTPVTHGRFVSVLRRWWLDALLITAILAAGLYYLSASPEFAANLPQDSFDFAVPAVNLLERGSMTISCYGKEFPPGHTFGMPLLLLPAYVIRGHFLGNGIYAITFCTLATLLLVYFIGRQVSGRLCGFVAALFLVSHRGYVDYSRKIMAEVPSVAFLAAILALALYFRRQPEGGRRIVWLLVGILIGFAVAIRPDNISVLVPFGLLVIRRADVRGQIARWAILCGGMLPWMFFLAYQNNAYSGSVFWSGQHFWGQPQNFPIFSPYYFLRQSFLGVHNYPAQIAERFDGNFVAYVKTLLSEVDMTLTYSRLGGWTSSWKLPYQIFIGLRTLIGVLGFFVAVSWWRRNRAAGAVMLWTASLTAVTFLIFGCYWWQEERYFLRLVPFFCLLNALGAVWLWTRLWQSKSVVRYTGIILPVALLVVPIAGSVFCERTHTVLASDDNLSLYNAFRQADGVMESNAVVITSYEHFRPDIYFVRGKQRISLPLSLDAGGGLIYPRRGAAPITPYEFCAVDRPEAIENWLGAGRPVYLMLREPLDGRGYPIAFDAIRSRFALQEIAFVNNGDLTMPYLFRLFSSPIPFRVN